MYIRLDIVFYKMYFFFNLFMVFIVSDEKIIRRSVNWILVFIDFENLDNFKESERSIL